MMLNWIHFLMNPLPDWLQVIIGIGIIAVFILILRGLPKMIDWAERKFKDFNKEEV